MTTFRPSCQVRIQLRIDELADTKETEATLEREPPTGASVGRTEEATQAGKDKALKANAQRQQSLAKQKGKIPSTTYSQEKSALDLERSALQLEQGLTTIGEQQKPLGAQEKDSSRNVVFNMLPLEARIKRQGISDATVCTLTLDHRDLPVDPRSVRAALVSVTLGTVSSDDYSAGILEGRVQQDGMLTSVVQRNAGQELAFRSTTRFVGFVDEWSIEFDDDGDTITLECKDVSALLRDLELPRGIQIDLKKPLDKGIQELVDLFPSSRGLKVVFGSPNETDVDRFVTGQTAPIPFDSLGRLQKSRKGKQAKAKKKTGSMKLYDHIITTCAKLGYVPIFRGFTLWIVEPRGLFSESGEGPKRMVYGRNLSALSFSRKLVGVKVPTMEIRSPDPTTGRTFWARHPVLHDEPKSGVLGIKNPVTTRANDVAPSGQAQEAVRVQSIPGISDLETLERIARNVWEEIGRQEIEGSFKTDDITAFESEREGDLLDLQAGDPVEILVAPASEVAPGDRIVSKPDGVAASLQQLVEQSIAARTEYLESLGFSRTVAKRLASAAENVPLANTFRAAYVNLSWSHDEGISIECSFYNFIVVRELEDRTPVVTGITPVSFSEAQAAV